MTPERYAGAHARVPASSGSLFYSLSLGLAASPSHPSLSESFSPPPPLFLSPSPSPSPSSSPSPPPSPYPLPPPPLPLSISHCFTHSRMVPIGPPYPRRYLSGGLDRTISLFNSSRTTPRTDRYDPYPPPPPPPSPPLHSTPDACFALEPAHPPTLVFHALDT